MKKTIVLSLILFGVVFVGIAVKFTYIQIFQADELQEDVIKQRVRTIKQSPERGEIVDSEGRTLAMSLNAKNIAVYPNIVPNEETRKNMAKLIANTLSLKYKDVFAALSSKDKDGNYLKWASILNRAEPELAETLSNSKYANYIEISNAPKRYFPNGSLGSTFLGFVNYENEPRAGVEMALNNYLGGVSGYSVAEFDATNNIIPIGSKIASEPVAGSKVTLTIDSYIQYTLEETIDRLQKENGAEAIHAIILNPNNGKVLAMASTPSYDPNNYSKVEDSSVFNTNASSYVYEPGSTFKPIYMAAALQQGAIDTNFTYNDPGYIRINGTNLYNWDKTGPGAGADLKTIILNSSNVGMSNISLKMTAKQALVGLKAIGVGTKTGIELPNEEVGLIPTVEQLENDPLMKATISYGQGISSTPLQIATLFSEIINGGYDVTPTLLEKVEDTSGRVQYSVSKEKGKRVYSEEVSKAMKSYLKANWEIGGAKTVAVDGYSGGGKTGSAWKVENGVYAAGKIIGSFIGYMPEDNPEYVMLAVVDDPKNSEFGSTSAGPVFKEVMAEVMRYKGINPDDIEEGEDIEVSPKFKIPDTKYELISNAEKIIKNSIKDDDTKVKFTQSGSGDVVSKHTYSYKNGTLTVNFVTVPIKNDEEKIYIPNIVGLKTLEVEKLFKKYNIDIKSHGTGKVKSQSIEPGVYTKKLKSVELWSE